MLCTILYVHNLCMHGSTSLALTSIYHLLSYLFYGYYVSALLIKPLLFAICIVLPKDDIDYTINLQRKHAPSHKRLIQNCFLEKGGKFICFEALLVVLARIQTNQYMNIQSILAYT